MLDDHVETITINEKSHQDLKIHEIHMKIYEYMKIQRHYL